MFLNNTWLYVGTGYDNKTCVRLHRSKNTRRSQQHNTITKIYLVVYRLPSWRQPHSKRCNNIDNKACELGNEFDADVKLKLIVYNFNKQQTIPNNYNYTITTKEKVSNTSKINKPVYLNGDESAQ